MHFFKNVFCFYAAFGIKHQVRSDAFYYIVQENISNENTYCTIHHHFLSGVCHLSEEKQHAKETRKLYERYAMFNQQNANFAGLVATVLCILYLVKSCLVM